MLTAERLRSLVTYDPLTGVFRWLETCGRRHKGKAVGSLHSGGYITTCVDARQYFVHRLVWLYEHGRWPEGDIDHVNGERGDNRLDNLRECTRAENLQNRRPSPLLGVSPCNGRYRAQIRGEGKSHHLGMFDTAEEAHAAYLAAKKEVHRFQPEPRAGKC